MESWMRRMYGGDLCPLMVFFSFSFSRSLHSLSLSFYFFVLSFLSFILNTLLTNPTMDRNNLWSIGTWTWTWTQTMDAVVWVWARTKTLSFLGIPSDDLPATHRNKNIVTKWRRSKEQRNKLASKHKVYAPSNSNRKRVWNCGETSQNHQTKRISCCWNDITKATTFKTDDTLPLLGNRWRGSIPPTKSLVCV